MIKIGKIVNTHGIKGELRIIDGPRFGCHEFENVGHVYIEGKKYELAKTRPHKQFILITLKEFSNINDVLQFKNKFIEIDGTATEGKMDPMNIMENTVYLDGKPYAKAKSFLETPSYFVISFDNGKNAPFTDKYFEFIDGKWTLKGEV